MRGTVTTQRNWWCLLGLRPFWRRTCISTLCPWWTNKCLALPRTCLHWCPVVYICYRSRPTAFPFPTNSIWNILCSSPTNILLRMLRCRLEQRRGRPRPVITADCVPTFCIQQHRPVCFRSRHKQITQQNFNSKNQWSEWTQLSNQKPVQGLLLTFHCCATMLCCVLWIVTCWLYLSPIDVFVFYHVYCTSVPFIL